MQLNVSYGNRKSNASQDNFHIYIYTLYNVHVQYALYTVYLHVQISLTSSKYALIRIFDWLMNHSIFPLIRFILCILASDYHLSLSSMYSTILFLDSHFSQNLAIFGEFVVKILDVM